MLNDPRLWCWVEYIGCRSLGLKLRTVPILKSFVDYSAVFLMNFLRLDALKAVDNVDLNIGIPFLGILMPQKCSFIEWNIGNKYFFFLNYYFTQTQVDPKSMKMANYNYYYEIFHKNRSECSQYPYNPKFQILLIFFTPKLRCNFEPFWTFLSEIENKLWKAQ